jgi:hypothetical protein
MMADTIQQIFELKQNKEVEQAASFLTFENARDLLKLLAQGEHREKISPIITGLPLEFFPQLIQENLPLFKKAISLESLQHKLILIASDISKALAKQANVLLEQEKLLRNLNPHKLYEECRPSLTQASAHVHQSETTMHILLELAWLSDRADFIELCSQVKERLVHLQLYLESLKKTLKERLDTIFGADDSIDAIEGLAAMGLLYPEDLKAALKRAGHKTKSASEPFLTKKMNETLKKAGLSTVKDLKDNEIYTLDLLIQFLKKLDTFPQV